MILKFNNFNYAANERAIIVLHGRLLMFPDKVALQRYYNIRKPTSANNNIVIYIVII